MRLQTGYQGRGLGLPKVFQMLRYKEYCFQGTKGLEAEALTCRLGRRIQIHMCGAKNEGCWERPFQRIPYLKLDFLVFLFSNSRGTPQNETFHSNGIPRFEPGPTTKKEAGGTGGRHQAASMTAAKALPALQQGPGVIHSNKGRGPA